MSVLWIYDNSVRKKACAKTVFVSL